MNAQLTSRTHATSPLPSSSSLLRLLTPFIALQSICPITPGSCPTKTDVECLLILFHHCTNLLCQDLCELLGPCEFDAMKYDDTGGLIQ